MDKLEPYRKKIDGIDEDIVKFLLLRFDAVNQISKIKKSDKNKIIDKKREVEVLRNIKKNSKHHEKFISDIFKRIISYSKKIQK